jgi:hypothetical protein
MTIKQIAQRLGVKVPQLDLELVKPCEGCNGKHTASCPCAVNDRTVLLTATIKEAEHDT